MDRQARSEVPFGAQAAGVNMIKAIHFKNFKALRDCTLPLGRLNILVGPNGSGKSTALSSLRFLASGKDWGDGLITAGVGLAQGKTQIELAAEFSDGSVTRRLMPVAGRISAEGEFGDLVHSRVYSFHAPALATSVQMVPGMEMTSEGAGLAGVLERLRDEAPERFEALNAELGHCLPEFDRILFTTPQPGHKAIQLRMREGGHKIDAQDLSQGTLLALAILTLAYLPDPPPIVGLEEPGRGIHPRLLRDVRDAIYRLAYPEQFGEQREPVQVIATTHSPYFLDLFRDEPEAIVICNKVEGNVEFKRLVDLPNIEEILGQTPPLGELWYSGILGGVPANR
jgi:predicted ATPase